MAANFIFGDAEDNAEIRLGELIMQLVGGTKPGNPEGYPIIYIGEVPEELPIDISPPAEGKILGAIARTPGQMTIYADAPSSPQRLIKFYEDRLVKEGAERIDMLRGTGGFMPDRPAGRQEVVYCMSVTGPTVQITAWLVNGSISELTIRITTAPEGLCNPTARENLRRAHQSILPPLYSPAGTLRTRGGRAGDSSHQYASAIIESEMPARDIMHHYSAQLENSSWLLLGEAAYGHSSVSHWQFEDGGTPCAGFFQVRGRDTHPRAWYLHIFAGKLDTPGDRPAGLPGGFFTEPTFVGPNPWEHED